MGVEHPRAGLDPAGLDEVDQRGHRLSLVDRVGEHAFEARAKPDRVDRLRVRDAVGAGVPLLEQDDLVVAELAAERDRLGGAARDAGDLLPGLLDGRRAVDPENAAFLPQSFPLARLRNNYNSIVANLEGNPQPFAQVFLKPLLLICGHSV